MLISKEIKVTFIKNQRKHYEKIASSIIGNIAIVPVENLSNGSGQIVEAQCDYCDEIVIIPYYIYNRSIMSANKFSCSHKCANKKRNELLYQKYGVTNLSYLDSIKEKRKSTNLEKYGVSSYTKTEEFKEKTKKTSVLKYGVDNYTKTDEYKIKTNKTNLEKYGVKWSLQSNDVRSKISQTNLEKYGYEQASKSDIVKDKMTKTNLEKYGVKSITMLDEHKAKMIENNLEKYGVDNYTKTDEYKIKTKETCMLKYGVDHHMKNPLIIETRRKNNLEKYGSTSLSHNEEFRLKNFSIAKHPDYVRYQHGHLNIFKCDKGHEFEIFTDNYFNRIKNNVKLCTICNPIGESQSIKEKDLFLYIESIYSGEIIQSYRDNLEIDIYLPELKIGFEFNGLYFHSEKFKDKNYHLNKTNYFKEKGIHIIHIWEDDWIYNEEIIKSQIRNRLESSSTKIFARKCIVKDVLDVKVIKQFLNENHIQGYVNSVVKLGLYYNDELISLMTFDHNEGRKKMADNEWNLSRFCTKLDTNVIGGASKLFKYFINNYKPQRIISYADKDWSRGDLYYKLGFELVSVNKPDYKYLIKGKRVHKSKFRKSNLNTELSESEYMKEVNIFKIWDCGKIKFQINIQS